MSILDDAIREHLELKRQHGAPDDEVKKLEDEAFGPPARPDGGSDHFAEAEAATEFMTLPDTGEASAVERPEGDEAPEPEGRRIPDIADLQEAPPAPEPMESEPAEEEHPAMEHEVVVAPTPLPDEPEPAGSHTTEERNAIAEQPTEMFDVESELADDEAPAPTDESAPSDEEIVDSEIAEPRLAPVDPLAGLEDDEVELPPAYSQAPEFDDDDGFFDEQRLSEELDQALEGPAPDEEISEEHAPEPEASPAPEPASHKDEEHEDVLEDTPDFLEESPEDDQLWFEQKPPKDFDFDD